MQLGKDHTKQMIAQDRLDEAIDFLLKQTNLYLSENKDDKFVGKLSDALLINSGKLNGLIHEQNLGIFDPQEAKITKAEVQKAILYVIDQLPENIFQSLQVADKTEQIELPFVDKAKPFKHKQDIETDEHNKLEEAKQYKQEKSEQKQKEEQKRKQLEKEQAELKLKQTKKQKTRKQAELKRKLEKDRKAKEQLEQKRKQKIWFSVLSIAIVLIITLFVWQPWKEKVETGNFTDPRDGKTYKTVKIGEQTWFAENFAHIPENGKHWTSPNDQDNKPEFGYYYDWETAKKVTPEGWHLPTKEEFETLLNYCGGNNSEKAYKVLEKGGDSNFNALFGGFRYGTGHSILIRRASFWSSSSKDNTEAWYMNLYNKKAGLNKSEKSYGYSVRCIKNN